MEDVKKPKVIVCMSTYNGEKYVEQQIESVLNQTYKNIEIFVRDDGSKDGTKEILKKYENEGKIHFINAENVGVVNSFFECLKIAYDNADFFAYCDQDDKWHEDKIENAMNKLVKENQNIPLLYFSEFNYCDEELNFSSKSSLNRKGTSFQNSLVECISFGIVEVFNKNLASKIITSGTQDVCFHDWWAYMIAAGLGKVIYENTAKVEYRRTGNNVSPSGKGAIQLQIYRIKKFLLGKYFTKIRKQIDRYKKVFGKELTKEHSKIANLFTPKYNLYKSIQKTFYPKRFRQRLIDELMCRTLFLFGRI